MESNSEIGKVNLSETTYDEIKDKFPCEYRGEIEVKIRLDEAVGDGQIFIPFCFAEGPANVLTNPKLDPYGKIPEFKYCAAKLEKVT